MKYLTTIVALAVSLITIPAFATESASATTGTSTASANATSGSASQASNAGNVQGTTINFEASQPRLIDRSVAEVNYGTQTIKNTPSVGGANLTTSNDTCMGSSTGSLNTPGLGVSVGSTWTDDHCKRLKMSRELWNKGMKAASLALDCMDADAKKALELTGFTCPQSMTEEERAQAFNTKVKKAAGEVAPVATVEETDPYKRMRAGLPPLDRVSMK